MAKKAVGKVKGTPKKSMVKLITPFKPSPTSSYKFREQVVELDKVQNLLKDKA